MNKTAPYIAPKMLNRLLSLDLYDNKKWNRVLNIYSGNLVSGKEHHAVYSANQILQKAYYKNKIKAYIYRDLKTAYLLFPMFQKIEPKSSAAPTVKKNRTLL